MKTTTSPSTFRRFATAFSVVILMAATLAATPYLAGADTVPPAGTPATVSADALPTAQINGIVWAQTIVGNTVYATGRFTQARPAGVAVGGAGSVTRTNLVAYDITTGAIVQGFNHSLTGGTQPEGRAIAASPDGKKLYVGGTFTTVDGKPHSNLVSIDLPTNTLTSTFNNGANGTVRALAATNTQVYAGGNFTSAYGQTHNRLLAYNATGTIVSGWAPSVTNAAGTAGGGAYVSAMTIAGGKLIFGGYFNQLNGATYYSTGAVNLTTGAPVAWASQSSTYKIMDQVKPGTPAGRGVGITSLSTDGSQVYLTSYHYAGTYGVNAFEGRAAISPADGHIIWVNDCHGDSYSAFPIGQVLYSVSHAHDCTPAGAYPDGNTRRALAETTYATGTNTATTNPGNGYTNYQGVPRGTQLDWYPVLNTANVSGSSQAAWSVTGNANYISLGGEFTTAEGKAQQGLVRYAVKSLAPNKIPPASYTAAGVSATAATSAGKSTVTFKTTYDRDNAVLTYKIYRNGGTTPVYTTTVDTRFWSLPSRSFTDSGLTPGTTASYKLVVTDPFGNAKTTTN